MLDAPFGIPPVDEPYNHEAEQRVLGALLHRNKSLELCRGLKPEDFYDPINARIFAAIISRIEKNRQADHVTIKMDFENNGILDEVGGVEYILSLYDHTLSPHHGVTEYAHVIRDTALRRRLMAEARRVAEKAASGSLGYDGESLAIECAGAFDLIAVQSGVLERKDTPFAAAVAEAMVSAESARSGEQVGISTGFRYFDARLGGLEKKYVYVLAARPGMGKSALAECIAINVARNGHRVRMVSLEMSAKQLGMRALAEVSQVPLTTIRTGMYTNEEAGRLVAAQKVLATLDITIDDEGGQTSGMIAAKARAQKRRGGLDLLVVDHLNLVRAEETDARNGGTWATGRASNAMLQIAKDCDIPVLLLCQLNRGPESREDKRPTLADLRQSGEIEQDAYAVGFLYRPEYYLGPRPISQLDESPSMLEQRIQAWREQKMAVAGLAEVNWPKIRDGEPGRDILHFEALTTSFTEPMETYQHA